MSSTILQPQEIVTATGILRRIYGIRLLSGDIQGFEREIAALWNEFGDRLWTARFPHQINFLIKCAMLDQDHGVSVTRLNPIVSIFSLAGICLCDKAIEDSRENMCLIASRYGCPTSALKEMLNTSRVNHLRANDILARLNREKLTECPICEEELNSTWFRQLPGCQHVVCRDCLRKWFHEQLQNRPLNQLPQFTCPLGRAPPGTSHESLTASDCIDEGHSAKRLELALQCLNDRDRKLHDLIVGRAALKNSNIGGRLWTCPRGSCVGAGLLYDNDFSGWHIFRLPRVGCPVCQECTALDTDYLPLFYRGVVGVNRLLQEFFPGLLGFMLKSKSRTWIRDNTKPCPRCKIPIEKGNGCDHMRCMACKHDFCWKCLGPVTGNYSCSHASPQPSVVVDKQTALHVVPLVLLLLLHCQYVVLKYDRLWCALRDQRFLSGVGFMCIGVFSIITTIMGCNWGDVELIALVAAVLAPQYPLSLEGIVRSFASGVSGLDVLHRLVLPFVIVFLGAALPIAFSHPRISLESLLRTDTAALISDQRRRQEARAQSSGDTSSKQSVPPQVYKHPGVRASLFLSVFLSLGVQEVCRFASFTISPHAVLDGQCPIRFCSFSYGSYWINLGHFVVLTAMVRQWSWQWGAVPTGQHPSIELSYRRCWSRTLTGLILVLLYHAVMLYLGLPLPVNIVLQALGWVPVILGRCPSLFTLLLIPTAVALISRYYPDILRPSHHTALTVNFCWVFLYYQTTTIPWGTVIIPIVSSLFCLFNAQDITKTQ